MKSLVPIIFVFIYSIANSNAHETWVHELIIKTAFKKLNEYYKIKGGDTTDLEEIRKMIFSADNHNLNYHTLFTNKAIWETPNPIIAGVYCEDYYDPLYDYSLFKYGGAEPVLTHFWNADNGVNYMSSFSYYPFGNYDNAYQKALRYALGTSYNMIDKISYFENTNYEAYKMNIKSPEELYNTGNAYIDGYYTKNNNDYSFVKESISFNYDIEKRKTLAYNILGRLLHLLADMSIPAHVHLQEHPCILGIKDYYELWIAGTDCNKTQPNNYPAMLFANKYKNKIDQNFTNLINIIDQKQPEQAIYHLFYVMSQLSDMFYSGGNSIIYPNIKGNNLKINYFDAYLDSIYKNVKPTTIQNINNAYCEIIANNTFEYCINATTALIYRFAKETNQINDKVLTNNKTKQTHNNPKFFVKYQEPFMIIEIENNIPNETIYFKLNDIYGREKIHSKLKQGTNKLHINNIKTGIYIYTIYNNQQILENNYQYF